MKKEPKQMKNEEVARTNEVVAVMAAKLARRGTADNQIAFLLKHGKLTESQAAEAYIRSGIGHVPTREIMEHIQNEVDFVLTPSDATPPPEPVPNLTNLTPIQKMVVARSRKSDTEK